MPQGLGVQLGLGGGRSATASGAPGATGSAFSDLYSVDFDGVDDNGSVGDVGEDAYAVSLWFKPDSTITTSSSSQVLLSLSLDSYGWGFAVAIGSVTVHVANELILVNTTNGGAYRRSAYTASGGTVSAAWHHLLVNFNTDVYDIWLDGTKVSNATQGGAQAVMNASNVTAGSRAGTNNFYAGLLDEVAIWDTAALSDAEIAAVYNSGEPTDLTVNAGDYTSASDLVGFWRMGDNDGGSGTTVTDQGSGSNNMTLQNGAAIVEDAP